MSDFCETLDKWSVTLHSLTKVTHLCSHNFSWGIGTESAKMMAFAESKP